MPVVNLERNKSQGAAVSPRPSAPSDVKMIPPATRGFRLPSLSDHIPMGIRNSTWGMAYAESTTPTISRLAPPACMYTGNTGT